MTLSRTPTGDGAENGENRRASSPEERQGELGAGRVVRSSADKAHLFPNFVTKVRNPQKRYGSGRVMEN